MVVFVLSCMSRDCVTKDQIFVRLCGLDVVLYCFAELSPESAFSVVASANSWIPQNKLIKNHEISTQNFKPKAWPDKIGV